MTDIPGDLMYDLPCMQQASYLEGGPLMWMLPLYLHVNKKSDDDDDDDDNDDDARKRIYNGCEGQIEKSVPQDHSQTSLGKPCNARQ